MTNRSSPYKWSYEKLVDQETDQQENLNLLGNKCDDNDEETFDYDPTFGRRLLQGQSSLDTANDQETIIADLEFSKDYYELKKRSQNERKLNKKSDHHHYIFHKIEKGDTLQGVALKWHCSLHELKRVNNLVSDQDFYGLAVIKIPIKKYGILSEVMVHQVNSSNLTLMDETPEEVTNKPLIINVGLRQTFLNDENTQDMNKFLTNLDADLAKMRKVADNYVQNDQNNASSISTNNDPTSSVSPSNVTNETITPKNSSNYQCDGADCGLSWYSLFFLALIILILIPVIYTFAFEKSHPFSHSYQH